MGRGADLGDVIAALARPPPRPSSDYDLNPDAAPPRGRVLKPAAVLVGVIDDRVILTKRASHLKHHPGQIAFPGGKQDPGDADATDAALREAREEIGLDRGGVRILGQMPAHETVTGYSVTPVVARIDPGFVPVVDAGEVAEAFRVPLSFVLDPSRFRIERRRWRGLWRRFHVVPYGPHYIWGATARMLKALADRVAS